MFRCLLDWGDQNNMQAEIKDSSDQSVAKLCEYQVDVVIGTDIVYWPQSIKPLMATLNSIFAVSKNGLEFYMCYIERHTSTKKILLAELEANKFRVEEIGQEISKPINLDSFIYKITKV